MKILTLNMNMFNYQNDGEFWNYLKEVNPDIAFIQEFTNTIVTNVTLVQQKSGYYYKQQYNAHKDD